MTKAQFKDAIKSRLSGGLPDRVNKFGDRTIYHFMDSVRKEQILLLYQAAGITDNFIKTFYPFLQWDDTRKKAYFKLPTSNINIIDDKGKDIGIQWISGMDDEYISWIISPNGAQQVFYNLEAGTTDVPVCYEENDRVWVSKILKHQTPVCIKVKLIAGIDGYSENEELPVPVIESQFIDGVCKLMQEMKLTPETSENVGLTK